MVLSYQELRSFVMEVFTDSLLPNEFATTNQLRSAPLDQQALNALNGVGHMAGWGPQLALPWLQPGMCMVPSHLGAMQPGMHMPCGGLISVHGPMHGGFGLPQHSCALAQPISTPCIAMQASLALDFAAHGGLVRGGLAQREACPSSSAPQVRWELRALDTALCLGVFPAHLTPLVSSVSLAKPFLRDPQQQADEFVWYKTWRIPDVRVQVHEGLGPVEVRLLAVTIGGTPPKLTTAPLRGLTQLSIEHGTAVFRSVMFEGTSFKARKLLFHLMVEAWAPSRPGAPSQLRECWLSAGVRVLSKRKAADALGAEDADGAHEAPEHALTPCSAGLPVAMATACFGGQMGSSGMGGGSTAVALVARPAPIPRGALACSRRESEHAQLGAPLAAAEAEPQRTPSALVWLSSPPPGWTRDFALLPHNRHFAVTVTGVTASLLSQARADSEGPGALSPVWCSDSAARLVGPGLAQRLRAEPLLSRASAWAPESVLVLAAALAKLSAALAKLSARVSPAGGGALAGGTEAAEAQPRALGQARLAIDCGLLHFRESGVRAQCVLYYNAASSRLTLLARAHAEPPKGPAPSPGGPAPSPGLGSHAPAACSEAEEAGGVCGDDALFGEVCDASPDCFKEADAMGFVTFCSAACRSLFGFEVCEVVGASIDEFDHKPDHAAMMGLLHALGLRVPSFLELVVSGPHAEDKGARQELSSTRVRGVMRLRTADGFRWFDFSVQLKWAERAAVATQVQLRASEIKRVLLWDDAGNAIGAEPSIRVPRLGHELGADGAERPRLHQRALRRPRAARL